MPEYTADKRARDNIVRGSRKRDNLGTATFCGLRAADPYLQWAILRHNVGAGALSTVGLSALPQGPPVVTNTPFDALGLSPYRGILFAMSVGSMVKQNFWLLGINQEEMRIGAATAISAFNSVSNGLNSLFFICAQTSASANGEHFPQTPLIVGSALYATGLFVEWFSEVQRAVWKRDPKNQGKVYDRGLFGLSRHVNYLGYTLWRTGYALAAGGWTWGAVNAGAFSFNFLQNVIPLLQSYLRDRYGDEYERYEQAVPYKFIPYIY